MEENILKAGCKENNNCLDGKFELRLVKESDIDLLFKWANDSLVRKNSFNSEQIPYEDHKKWFIKLINDSLQKQYIFMKNKEPVGQIRFSMSGTEAEISYSVAPGMRGHGYGKIMLELAKKIFHEEHPEILKLIGKIKPENTASEKCFMNCEFEEAYRQFEFNYEV